MPSFQPVSDPIGQLELQVMRTGVYITLTAIADALSVCHLMIHVQDSNDLLMICM
jgi:hypothetical protein